jgi:hypothetical protein
MRGLDPRIHDAFPHAQAILGFPFWRFTMDCRVKPGNDSAEGAARA